MAQLVISLPVENYRNLLEGRQLRLHDAVNGLADAAPIPRRRGQAGRVMYLAPNGENSMGSNEPRTDERSPLLSADELAEALHVSTATVAHWRRSGMIPYVRFSRRVVRYRLADALAAFERSAGEGVTK
jgi:hypothetical protein